MHTQKTVVVGMSGGVDSSVAALLLKKAGYRVIGMFMKNWEDVDAHGNCHTQKDWEDVSQVCKLLNIPFYPIHFVEEYREKVFSEFLEELKKGHTPNPDVLCNREIKFKVFLEKAMVLGADFLATGHYCQISNNSSYALLKGNDPHKDQSYFLYTLSSSILEKVLFPIGHLLKSQVRQIAREHQLPTSEKKDSTGICFIGKRNFKTFLTPYLGYQPGNFETLEGKVVGQHDGMAYFTIGQRKGLKIGGAGDAWFVVGKDPSRNIVYVEQGKDHPCLYADTLIATDIHWITGNPPSLPFSTSAKLRYRQMEQPCTIEAISENRVWIRFLTPQRAITPRQSIVFYDREVCLGGGFVLQTV